jgi:hypothetical protein
MYKRLSKDQVQAIVPELQNGSLITAKQSPAPYRGENRNQTIVHTSLIFAARPPLLLK